MLREFSAGGIVIDDARLAVIRPQGRPEPGTGRCRRARSTPASAVSTPPSAKCGRKPAWWPSRCGSLEPVKYVYQRAGERIFKVVTFWVMAAVGGELGAIAEEMRVEVAEAAWVALADAP